MAVLSHSMSQFIGHGTFEARKEGRIVIFKAVGPWNIESMDAAADEFIQLSKPLYGSPWGMVGDFYGQPVHVPEAASKLTEIVKMERTQGRVATGLVVEHCDLPILGKEHLGEVYGNAGENFAFFTRVSDAVAWVEQQISAALTP